MSGFDTTPTARILKAMQSQSWTVHGALSELVDNSFGPGRGNARRVEITHDPKARRITIFDDGKGMVELGRLFQLGSIEQFDPSDIGQYGSGGTMAILWLASKVELWTLRDGQVSHDRVDWTQAMRTGHFPVVSDEWMLSTMSNTPAALYEAGHGTLITLQLLRERRFRRQNVTRDLARTYAPGLRLGKELVWTTKDKETIRLADPLALPDELTESFDLTIEKEGQHLGVVGQVGYIENLPASRSHVAVGFGPRVIKTTKDCYQSADGSRKYVGAGIGGWLDLGPGWQPYLTTTKDGVNDQPLWDTLMQHVFERIEPLLAAVDEEKLDLILEGIALNLSTVFANRVTVDVPGLGGEGEEPGEDITGLRHGTDEPDQGIEPTTPTGAGEDDGEKTQNKEEPAQSRIDIKPVSDAQMLGRLCDAALRGADVVVYVNKDYPAIQEAMVAKPINRMALNLLVTGEIAPVLAADRKLWRRVFKAKRSVVVDLESREEREREQVIHRLLMDAVHKELTAA